MPSALRIEIRDELDQPLLEAIGRLLTAATAAGGDRPLGEEKHSQLSAGARAWTGILAFDGDDLVGYAHVRWHAPGTTPRLVCELVVHPDHRAEGLARTLLLEVRAVLARAGGGELWLWAHRVADPAATLPAHMGLVVQRALAFMAAPLDARPEPAALPEGVAVRPFRPGADDAALLEVNNAAFAGHPENGGWDAAELADRLARPWVDPAGLLLAWRGDELLGFHWTKWHPAESEETAGDEPVGEVYVLGISPAAQGLGLGRALLRAGLAHLHDRGARRALLYVDTATPAAVGLYRSEGFATVHHEVCYADVAPPVVDRRA